jgi:hypothetical protein
LLKRLKFYFVKTQKGKNMTMGKIFNPEKYGMVFCPDCKGKGKLPKNLMALLSAQDVEAVGPLEKKRKLLKKIENKRNITESSELD